MQYPQYPEPRENPTPKETYPKDSLSEVMDTYEKLTRLGLVLLPKQRDKKLPDFSFWRKENPLTPTPQLLERVQERDDISGWCIRCGEESNSLFVIDIDTHEVIKSGNDPVLLYEKIQAMSPSGFVLRTPANGVHIYYRIPDDKEMLSNSAPPIAGLDVRGEGGQVVSLHGYNRYDGDYAEHKGVVDGHTGSYERMPYGNYSYVPVMTDMLYEWVKQDKPEKRAKTKRQIKGENYGKTGIGQERVDRHFTQAPEDRVRVVKECLDMVLENWNDQKSYDDWIQLWMSAHHGSSGDTDVRDQILESEKVYWSDGDTGRRHFRQAWEEHQPDEDGFTVASLFYLARQEGWLADTGYELTAGLGETTNYRYVSEWLATELDVPRRVLLRSQTGSGKTWNIGTLWRRLGEPKTVIFVPTIKLATELSYTLAKDHNIKNTLYIDDDTQEIIPLEEMVNAHFLVTTLQTFAVKVSPHVEMKDYGLVYVEESDQLIGQFSRGGGGMYGTHVNDNEARKGFAVLRGAMADAGCVWFVDATMTKVTYYLAEALKQGHEVRIILNEWVEEKPSVTFVESYGEGLQEALRHLEAGRKVVVSADTKNKAKEVYDTMLSIGATTNAILITADTKHLDEVQEFMRDVNEGAKKYDLVCYSPVMASGVSITSVRPALILQIATWLTPRYNLQMLNRYRKQAKVICHYRNIEMLYGKKSQEIMEEAKERAWIESRNVRIPMAIRNSDAELRSQIASIAVGDAELQMRASKEFYVNLLNRDGRSVQWGGGEPVSEVLKHTLKGVREAKKEQKKLIARTWHTVQPIDRENPPTANMSDLDVARGEVHAYIKRCLFGNVPENEKPEEIYKVVDALGKYGYHLDAFIRQEDTVQRAETYLADDGKALMSLNNNVTMIKVVSLVRHLYDSLDDELDQDKVESRAEGFLKELELRREMYDAIIPRSRQQYEAVLERTDDPVKLALSFSKILLARIGLKQRAERDNREGGEPTYVYTIANAPDVIKFLEWRNEEAPDVEFDDDKLEQKIGDRTDANTRFSKLSEDDQAKVFKLMKKHIPFEKALDMVDSKDKLGGF